MFGQEKESISMPLRKHETHGTELIALKILVKVHNHMTDGVAAAILQITRIERHGLRYKCID